MEDNDNPLTDGLMNFYSLFPISPIYWLKFYAIDDDALEIQDVLSDREELLP
jgi:hypothetical protein